MRNAKTTTESVKSDSRRFVYNFAFHYLILRISSIVLSKYGVHERTPVHIHRKWKGALLWAGYHEGQSSVWFEGDFIGLILIRDSWNKYPFHSSGSRDSRRERQAWAAHSRISDPLSGLELELGSSSEWGFRVERYGWEPAITEGLGTKVPTTNVRVMIAYPLTSAL